MKRLISYLAVSLLVVTALSCQKEPGSSEHAVPDNISASTAPTDTHAPAAAARAPYDLQFIDSMTKHHASAVAMAKMAQGRIEHARLKELVAKIPPDQQKQIDQMKTFRDQWYPGAASAETMQMPGMSSGMKMDDSSMQSMKPGRDYDLMFINMMVPHHEAAVSMAREALGRAEHQQIKTLAQQIIDAQTKEIAQMKTWKEALSTEDQAHKR